MLTANIILMDFKETHFGMEVNYFLITIAYLAPAILLIKPIFKMRLSKHFSKGMLIGVNSILDTSTTFRKVGLLYWLRQWSQFLWHICVC